MLTGAGACVGTTAGTARAGRPGGSAGPTRSTWPSTAARPAAAAADTAAGTPARVGTTQLDIYFRPTVQLVRAGPGGGGVGAGRTRVMSSKSAGKLANCADLLLLHK